MKASIVGAGLVLPLILEPASGENVLSANRIMPGCRAFISETAQSAMDYFDAGECVGTVLGLAQGADLQSRLQSPQGSRPFCIPTGVTIEQMARVVVKYIDQHPKDTHQAFTSLAYIALGEAWPCKP